MSSGGVVAAAYAAMANAVKASGAIVRVENRDFMIILNKTKDPLVIYAKGNFITGKHQYLTAYKGLVFHTKSGDPLPLPSAAEIIHSNRIWLPS